MEAEAEAEAEAEVEVVSAHNVLHMEEEEAEEVVVSHEHP